MGEEGIRVMMKNTKSSKGYEPINFTPTERANLRFMPIMTLLELMLGRKKFKKGLKRLRVALNTTKSAVNEHGLKKAMKKAEKKVEKLEAQAS